VSAAVCPIGTNSSRRPTTEKAEDFSSAFPWLVPSPRHFANIKAYCNGDSLVVHVVIEVALYRTTASANEQK
jgi:hypothetical protein